MLPTNSLKVQSVSLISRLSNTDIFGPATSSKRQYSTTWETQSVGIWQRGNENLQSTILPPAVLTAFNLNWQTKYLVFNLKQFS